uniref:Uncharacterized protein n=1 Tax=Oryza barthii TaxID=65489 RepID=A0A0D3GLZ8_9ORYZ
MALRSLSLSLARTMTTTLRRRPPPRSLHHHQDNKLSGMTSPKTEAPTGSVNRMVITGAVSAYCIALFILSSMRNKVKEDLRNLCNNYD